MGCASLFIPAVLAVKKSHHTFNNSNISALHFLCKSPFNAINPYHPCIKVVGRSSANQSMVRWVNIIRPNLERLNSHASFFKQCHKTNGNGGFANSAMSSRYYESLHTFHLVKSFTA